MLVEPVDLKFIPDIGIKNLGEKLSKYLAKRDGTDRLMPKARVVDIVYLGVVTNYSLFRTEGTTTIDTVELPRKNVTTPVIMPQKITAIMRRRLTELLRRYMELVDENERRRIVCRELELGYTKAFEHVNVAPPSDFKFADVKEINRDGSKIVVKYEKKKNNKKITKTLVIDCNTVKVNWDCFIQPPLEQGTDLGMDTYCPACILFGAVITDTDNINMRASGGSLNIGIKSRVVVDPAFSLYPRYEFKTHQKVAEGALSTTGMSLYKEPHMIPASLVVGKIALYDVTEAELLATLLALVSAKRYGGRQTRYGGLEIYPIAVSAEPYERISALELAENLVSDRKKSLDKAIAEIKDILSGDSSFVLVVEEKKEGDEVTYQHALRNTILRYLDNDEKFKALFKELWDDALAFNEALINRVKWLKSKK